MAMGRPKLEIARTKDVHIRLTQIEFEKLERIAKKKEISKTEAILQGIDLLIHYKPKRIAKKNVDEILRERGALTAD